jgi:uncharacterized repeat protein (TIGR03803 family)
MRRMNTKALAANTPGLVKTCSFRGLTVPLALMALLVLGSVPPAHAQTYTFTTLYNFTGTNGDGDQPIDIGGLIMDSSGNLYGTTSAGGTLNNACIPGSCGTVFKLDTHGNETVLHTFDFSDGGAPLSGLISDKSNNLYGTTQNGGGGSCNGGCGTAFKLDPNGNNFATLYSFTSANGDGAYPVGGLTMGTQSGTLYGATQFGGGSGAGTVFDLDLSSNTETVVYSFKGSPNDGANPIGNLVTDSAGNLYGTTSVGGISNTTTCNGVCGIVFKVDANGNETVLHYFDFNDGAFPLGGLVLDGSGNLYGTTENGGSSTNCPGRCGTVFKLDTNGNNFTVLHNFGLSDGANPVAGLIMDGSGNLYGTTESGGSSANCPASSNTGSPGCGTIFKLGTNGNNFTVLHSFNRTDGSFPSGALLRDASGNLYGTTEEGGSSSNCFGNCGTVFEMSPVTEVPFSAFSAKLDITSGRSPGFQLSANLTQGAGATAINPVQQGMTLSVGTYTVAIPAGSFQALKKGVYAYQGTINGVALQVRISQTGTSSYLVQVDASGVNLSTLTNPVPVTLTLGQNSGTVNVTAQF